MLDKVAVIGAGTWGTTVAAIASRSAPTLLWARRPELAEAIDIRHENPDYLPGITLPDDLRATTSLSVAVDGAALVVMAFVPSSPTWLPTCPPAWPSSAWPRASSAARISA
jgi:glycerol-3-phosphate dehydrogenase (NAD(P)+)